MDSATSTAQHTAGDRATHSRFGGAVYIVPGTRYGNVLGGLPGQFLRRFRPGFPHHTGSGLAGHVGERGGHPGGNPPGGTGDRVGEQGLRDDVLQRGVHSPATQGECSTFTRRGVGHGLGVLAQGQRGFAAFLREHGRHTASVLCGVPYSRGGTEGSATAQQAASDRCGDRGQPFTQRAAGVGHSRAQVVDLLEIRNCRLQVGGLGPGDILGGGELPRSELRCERFGHTPDKGAGGGCRVVTKTAESLLELPHFADGCLVLGFAFSRIDRLAGAETVKERTTAYWSPS